MPLYREENFLVVHPGSEHTLFSFGLQESLSPPEYKIPSVVYQNPVTKEYQASKPEDSIEEVIEINPIRASKIVDIEAFKYLLKLILQSVIAKNPIVTINQIPLLLIIPSSCWSRHQIEEITKYAMETLEFTGFNVLDLSIASTFGMGNGTSSCIVNIGKDSTQISPVLGYKNIAYASKYLSIGGSSINNELNQLIPNLSCQQIEWLKTSNIYEVVSRDSNNFYSVADLNKVDEGEASEDEKYDVAKIVTENEDLTLKQDNETKNDETTANGEAADDGEAPQPEIKSNHELETNFFIDPDTKGKIYIGKERFQGAATLINEVAKNISTVLASIPDLEKRQECFDNLIFVGSTFKIKGFKHALMTKLSEDYLVRSPQDQKANEVNVNSAIAAYQQADDVNDTNEGEFIVAQVPTSIRLAKHPDYFPEWKRPKDRGGSWEDVYFLGGQIYAKQVFGGNSNSNGELFVDSDNYEERGPQSVWNARI